MANKTYDVWFPQHLATLTRKIPAQRDPFGYGIDTAMVVTEEGVLDIDPLRRETSPTTFSGIFQACVRRLVTPSGRLREHRRYGFDVLSLLNRGITQQVLATVPAQVERELRKDTRILSVKCRAYSTGLDTLNLEIQVQPKNSRESFQFVFSADGTGRLTAELA